MGCATCGGGVGCDTGKPVPLCVTQGQPLSFRMRWWRDGQPQDLTGRSIVFEVRSKPGGPLLLDVAPFCTVDPEFPDVLVVEVPAVFTRDLPSSGVWDVFIDSFRLAHGPMVLSLAVSVGTPTVLVSAGWNPVLGRGEGLVRRILLDGLFDGRAVDPVSLRVADSSGRALLEVSGGSRALVDNNGRGVSLRLGPADLAVLPVGRHVYSLSVSTPDGSPRTVLAGMLSVLDEGGAAGGDGR